VYLKGKLLSKGFAVPDYDPVEGGEGWQLKVDKDGGAYSLFVMWAPLGDPPIDYWVIQVSPRRSLIKQFLGKSRDASNEAYLKEELEKVVRNVENVSDIRWLNDEQFRSEY
jgi:hypothetical protein